MDPMQASSSNGLIFSHKVFMHHSAYDFMAPINRISNRFADPNSIAWDGAREAFYSQPADIPNDTTGLHFPSELAKFDTWFEEARTFDPWSVSQFFARAAARRGGPLPSTPLPSKSAPVVPAQPRESVGQASGASQVPAVYGQWPTAPVSTLRTDHSPPDLGHSSTPSPPTPEHPRTPMGNKSLEASERVGSYQPWREDSFSGENWRDNGFERHELNRITEEEEGAEESLVSGAGGEKRTSTGSARGKRGV